MTRTLVTAALPYANGPLHIGHLAGAYLPADLYVRHQRQQGREVLFVCGSDEYGAAIAMRAHKEGTTPAAIVEKYHHLMQDTFSRVGISFDIYHRTSDPLHHETAQEFFRYFYTNGLFEEIESEQYYDEQAQVFLADRYILGTCPVCDNPDAYGDQCERCGTSLSPAELKNPRSALSGAPPVKRMTRHWYLPLDRMEEHLRNYVEGHAADWKHHVLQQCRSWLEQGLKPRAMTRDLDWGIPVPAEIPGSAGKVLYVWFDAPIGYISATKAWAQREGKDWQPWWQSTDTRLIHFIGKDNIVFHCLTFPGILMQRGKGSDRPYIWADNVPANEFLNLEGQKISTSRNHAIWLDEFVNRHPDRVDALRFYLTSILPEQADADFTWKDFQTRHNSELVAILGNFVHRTLVLVQKFCGGRVPALQPFAPDSAESQLTEEVRNLQGQYNYLMEHFQFRGALATWLDMARVGNKYLADSAPWHAIKQEGGQARVEQILAVSLHICRTLQLGMEPILPESARKLAQLLGLDEKGQVVQNATLPEPYILFPQIEDEWVAAEVQRLAPAAVPAPGVASDEPEQPKLAPLKAQITYDQFEPLDLRTGKILTAEKVQGADKLLKLTVDIGHEVRTIVSGIARHFAPETLVGRQVVVVANLAPRKLRGIESQGMILTAEDAKGNLHWVAPQTDLPPGGIVK